MYICTYTYIHIYVYCRQPGSPSPPMPFFPSVQPQQHLCFKAIYRASLHDSFGTCFSLYLQCSKDCLRSWLSGCLKT